MATDVSLSDADVEEVTLELAGRSWQLRKPKGYKALAVADQQGVLWVKHPPAIPGMTGWGMRPRPDGDYAIMYTPLRPEGGVLAKGARLLMSLPGGENGSDTYVVSLAAVAGERFLVRTYSIHPNAQNGGAAGIWWIEPASARSKTVISTPPGGGDLVTVVDNDEWLFWSSASTGEAGTPVDVLSFLVELSTGEATPVDLGGSTWARQAWWTPDGMLNFRLQGENTVRTLDPARPQAVGPARPLLVSISSQPFHGGCVEYPRGDGANAVRLGGVRTSHLLNRSS